MNDTGPEAVPPPARSSLDERRGDKFVPVPEPYLNSIPSVFARVRIDSMVSSTELMKHALPCGFGSTPTLNHTGELNDIFWYTSRCLSSASNVCASASVSK